MILSEETRKQIDSATRATLELGVDVSAEEIAAVLCAVSPRPEFIIIHDPHGAAAAREEVLEIVRELMQEESGE